MTDQPRTLNRRSLAKGAAWSVPAIAIAASAPASATSGPKPTGTALATCKQPGGSCSPIVKGYLFKLTLKNNDTSDPIWVYTSGTYAPIITDSAGLGMTYAGAYVNGTWYAAGTNFQVPAGATVTIILNAASDNSANTPVEGTITVQWGHTSSPTDDTMHVGDPLVIPYNFTGTPPCDGCTLP